MKSVVHLVLDASGSMNIIRDNTIDAFNRYVSTLAETSPETEISLTLFNGVEGTVLRYLNVPAKVGRKLTRADFNPQGGTPLYDAIGTVIAQLHATYADKKALVILTDGEENMSTRFSATTIKEMLEQRQKKDDWLVVYLGANQDAFNEGAKFGTVAASTMTFNVNNINATLSAAARSTAAYSKGLGAEAYSFTAEERKSAI